jgi:hypothetical protein
MFKFTKIHPLMLSVLLAIGASSSAVSANVEHPQIDTESVEPMRVVQLRDGKKIIIEMEMIGCKCRPWDKDCSLVC